MRGGVGHGGRREHERRRRAVAGGDPSQPTQHRRDVRAEHPAVDVALVDDDVLQRAQEPRPPLVPRQQRMVQEVGVGEHDVGVVADPPPLVGRRVAVVRGRPHPGDRHRLDPGELVGGQRLGRREVDGRRAPQPRRGRPLGRRAQHRREVAQALAGCRSGRDHDVLTGRGEVDRGPLVRPRALHPRGQQGRQHGRRDGPRPLRQAGRSSGDVLDVEEAFALRTSRQDGEVLCRTAHDGYGNPWSRHTGRARDLQ